MEKRLNPEQYIKDLETHIVSQKQKIEEYSTLLGQLVLHVEEDIPWEQGTRHLWKTMDEANELLAGPTRSYVDQG